MPNAVWPASLPSPNASGFSQTLADNVVRTEMDAGPAKVRRRSTSGVKPATHPLLLDATQKDTLISFYETTLVSGTLPFDHTDFLNSGTVAYRFVTPPGFTSAGANLWNALLDLEILP